MRGVAELLKSALLEARARETSPDELPSRAQRWPTRAWVSSAPRVPRDRPRIVANIRSKPADSVGDCRRPAALGTLLEGALAFALDDAVDNRCETVEIRLLDDGSAKITHTGPGYPPARASLGLQHWPWLRRSAEGEIFLTQNLAAPVVTCALSHWYRLEIRLEHQLWTQAFYRGEAECLLQRHAAPRSLSTWTRVHFRPDPLVFEAPIFDIDDLYMRALGLTDELAGVELRIIDERSVAPALVFTSTGGHHERDQFADSPIRPSS